MNTHTSDGRWVELDPSTIRAALDGDRAAFARLYRHYRGVVRGAVAARLRAWRSDMPQLEDVLSEVWVQMLANDRKALRSYDPSRGEFGYFIRMVAGSRAASVLRSRSRAERPRASRDADEGVRIERLLMQRDFIEALWDRARPQIKEVDETLFVQVMVMGREAKEVAGEVGLGQDAAYQRLARLRQRLIDLAGKLLEGEAGRRPPSAERLRATVVQAWVLVVASSVPGDAARPMALDEPSGGALQHDRAGSMVAIGLGA